MTYLNFSEALLDSFPDFREYYLSELKADEIDLLPSNITFAFIGFYDKQDLKANRSKVESIINFLEKMKYSGDEDLVMLYNETLINRISLIF